MRDAMHTFRPTTSLANDLIVVGVILIGAGAAVVPSTTEPGWGPTIVFVGLGVALTVVGLLIRVRTSRSSDT